MAILKVKDANGNVIDIPAIRGEKGKDGKNGVDGKDGYTPQKGIDYFDGKDYVLTDADKTEIANTVVDLLPKYNGEVETV